MIEGAEYTEFGFINFVINGVSKFVADSPDNIYRRKIAEWEAQGNVIEPYGQ